MKIIEDNNVLQILQTLLRHMDARLVEHGERVAYLCMKLMEELSVPKTCRDQAVILALYHDIGAFKTDEIDRLLSFETKDVWDHAVYGYLFLSNLSPLKDHADCVLYHHMSYAQLQHQACSLPWLASLIHLCDRIDIALQQDRPLDDVLHIPHMFMEEQKQAFFQLNQDNALCQALLDGSYQESVISFFHHVRFSEHERKQYLEMLAYSIDFNSEFTVLHTIMTTSLAVELGKFCQLQKRNLEQLYYGALLHDIGKAAIPINILEKAGTLTVEEMALMRTHVNITEEILKDFVDPVILHNAIRHHEKLDGTGYPYGLTEQELKIGDRIVAISDILSALLGKRSYKEPLPISVVLNLIQELADSGKVDADIVSVFVHHQEEILSHVQRNSAAMQQLYQTMLDEYSIIQKQMNHTVHA